MPTTTSAIFLFSRGEASRLASRAGSPKPEERKAPKWPKSFSADFNERTVHFFLVAMFVVGLTGGIASGKSSVAAVLRQYRIHVIDLDAIAARVTRRGAWGYRRVLKALGGLGTDITTPDGDLDRAKVRRIVFMDAEARKRLNRATHLPIAVR